MSWLQLRLDVQRSQVETLEGLMLTSGAVAVTMEDNADEPVLEPGVGETPLWGHTRLTGLYPADTDMDQVLHSFAPEALKLAGHRIEILEDKDWEREWMQHYHPMQFGPRLWVCPSWMDPPDPDGVNLLLDPGLAFGTGTHPTTAMCLSQLDRMNLKDSVIIDYGCGSGILAVATLKLGAARALGVDNDPQALVASQDNAARNGLGAEALVVTLPDNVDTASWLGSADTVIANILAGPLMELSNTLLALMQPTATLMLAGLLESQADALIAHYRPHIKLVVVDQQDEWVCLRGTRSPK